MKLTLKRRHNKSTYCIGDLYIDGIWFSNIIEDVDRHLSDDMPLDEIKNKKVYCETAIPYGTYKITLDVKSPKYSNFSKYPWAKKYEGYIPRLKDVKGFEGVLIHVGNYATQSCGCLLVGFNTKKGMVTSSVYAFNKLMDEYLIPATERNEEITITITSDYH